MNSNLAHLGVFAAAWVALVALPCAAQQAALTEPAASARPAVLASEQPEAGNRGGEPDVRHSVIEGHGSKIDELRVRGQTQRITVTPKIGPRKSYDIITGDASRDSFYGTGGARNATGKRVWDVLDF